ncbi:MAG: tetratricopeptide repeat protein [Bacteroidales bacterium]|nr:tetratricopeptide repeat protein [Bacteroidales bacterium]
MKKTLLLLISALIYNVAALAAAPDNADSAYSQSRYQDAIRLYEAQAQAEGTSSDLYYNLGCAHYKMQDVPRAILYFERALVLDPGNDDARDNLTFIREKAKIAPSTSGSFFSDLLQQSVSRVSSNAWAIMAAVIFVLLLLAIAAYIFMGSILLRKVGFFSAGLLLVAFIATLACAFYQRAATVGHSQAIVMPQSATLSTAPHAPSEKEVAFRLKGGMKVNIVDSVKTAKPAETWYKVESKRNQQAWILATDIEKI